MSSRYDFGSCLHKWWLVHFEWSCWCNFCRGWLQMFCQHLIPTTSSEFQSSKKLQWLACELLLSCFLSTQWQCSEIPCFPNVIIASAKEHSFCLFSLTCCTDADTSWFVTGWVWPDIHVVSMKWLASSTAGAWYFASLKWLLRFTVAFFQLVKGQLTIVQ